MSRPPAAPPALFAGDATAERDALLASTLTDAVRELQRRFGADPGGWRYGQPANHHALIRHPLGAALDPPASARRTTSDRRRAAATRTR